MKGNGRDLVAYSLTDAGKNRVSNEDSFLYAEIQGRGGGTAYLMTVADGMGSNRRGEIASRRIIEIFKGYINSDPVENVPAFLKEALTEANRSIYEMSYKTSKLQMMGSTCTAMFWMSGKAYIAHVGDSSTYLIRRGEVIKLTKDHTVDEEMAECRIIPIKRSGVCAEGNFPLRAIGINSEVEVDLLPPVNTEPGDIFVLCSDGLTDFVREDEIRDIVNLYSPDEACHILVSIANERGGGDNITVQVAKALVGAKSTSGVLDGLKDLCLWFSRLAGFCQ
ncbi:MAG TPA: protein phosphatase 2C domain-containing protein [Thermodesulfobacteriota bacterium]|nr:protein phosphatase 2C domain-containing protein [Thermodesulfobacteriota bacterium]